MHRPVLLEQAVAALRVKPDGLYIDATAGEGGHIQKVMELGGKVLALDWDSNQVKKLELKIKNAQFVQSNYAEIEQVATEQKFQPVDGVLFDFGLSMEQLSKSGRGFSYKNLDEPLDMRISTELPDTAQDFIISLSEEELYEKLSRYSEELHSRAIAESIVRTRRIKKFGAVGDLVLVIDDVIRNCTLKHDHAREQMYSRVFQALRILVNHEFENIQRGLQGALNILKKDGRVVAITFHSLEDRIVKNFVRKNNELRLVEEKVPKRYERPRYEKSAVLRIIEFKQ